MSDVISKWCVRINVIILNFFILDCTVILNLSLFMSVGFIGDCFNRSHCIRSNSTPFLEGLDQEGL